MRKERDFLGEREIREDALYGIHAWRAFENFGDIGERTDPVFVRSYLLVKKACALANRETGFLDGKKADSILQAIDGLLERGDFHDVLINPLSGGAGTSLNMNINEIVANSCREEVDPADDVNLHQSTNDTYPTAFKTALMFYLQELEQALTGLQDTLQKKEKEFGDVVKLGRTELMDALPITVGMQFSAYAEAVARDRWRVFKARERIKTVNLGGTAIGTGFNAPQKYIFCAIGKLQEVTGLNLSRAENMVDATQNLDGVVEVMAIVKALAVNLHKIAEDLRILSGGPEGGIGELILPPVQEGSSIMPGKANPVIPEFVLQISLLVIGNDSVISTAAAGGNMELNQFYPLISTLSLKNMRMLLQAVLSLDRRCLAGITVDRERIRAHLSDSMAILTYLSQYLGHAKASELYLRHRAGEKDLKKLILQSGALTESRYEELLQADKIRMLGYK